MDKLPVRNKYVKLRDEYIEKYGDEEGIKKAKEWMREVRSHVNPKNIKGRPKVVKDGEDTQA